ncbi:MAG: hypothetical protein R2713_06170 [Ilumatobacteraceae bacterium]
MGDTLSVAAVTFSSCATFTDNANALADVELSRADLERYLHDALAARDSTEVPDELSADIHRQVIGGWIVDEMIRQFLVEQGWRSPRRTARAAAQIDSQLGGTEVSDFLRQYEIDSMSARMAFEGAEVRHHAARLRASSRCVRRPVRLLGPRRRPGPTDGVARRASPSSASAPVTSAGSPEPHSTRSTPRHRQRASYAPAVTRRRPSSARRRARRGVRRRRHLRRRVRHDRRPAGRRRHRARPRALRRARVAAGARAHRTTAARRCAPFMTCCPRSVPRRGLRVPRHRPRRDRREADRRPRLRHRSRRLRRPDTVAHTPTPIRVLSAVKPAAEQAEGDEPVVILQRLGTADEAVVHTTWADLDRTSRPTTSPACTCPGPAHRWAPNSCASTSLRLCCGEQCPWDQEQTHRSLVKYLLEETYEVVDASRRRSRRSEHRRRASSKSSAICCTRSSLHATIAEQEGRFTIADVARQCTTSPPPPARVPTAGGDTVTVGSADEVVTNWDAIKRAEKQRTSVFDGVPTSQPSLGYAYAVQRKAAKVGFDWPDVHGAVPKIAEETAEVLAAHADGDDREVEREIGDLLFAVVERLGTSASSPSRRCATPRPSSAPASRVSSAWLPRDRSTCDTAARGARCVVGRGQARRALTVGTADRCTRQPSTAGALRRPRPRTATCADRPADGSPRSGTRARAHVAPGDRRHRHREHGPQRMEEGELVDPGHAVRQDERQCELHEREGDRQDDQPRERRHWCADTAPCCATNRSPRRP